MIEEELEIDYQFCYISSHELSKLKNKLKLLKLLELLKEKQRAKI